jgi:putative DNA primase/helicase
MKQCERNAVQRSMLTNAEALMDISVEEFDVNNEFISCRNGIVNLRTMEIVPHAPDQLHLRRTNTSYLPHSPSCTRWLQFLDQIFLGDTELIKWVQTAAGYSITGLSKTHVFFLCYGTGGNGKSTFLEVILNVLGDYGHKADFQQFLQKDRGNVRLLEAKANLKGKRFAVASETSDSSRLNEGLIKELTGGDKISGSYLHSSSFQFDPTHHICFSCNHKPAIMDASVGMWKRVKVIPLTESFLDSNDDIELRDKLRKEKDGSYRWDADRRPRPRSIAAPWRGRAHRRPLPL